MNITDFLLDIKINILGMNNLRQPHSEYNKSSQSEEFLCNMTLGSQRDSAVISGNHTCEAV